MLLIVLSLVALTSAQEWNLVFEDNFDGDEIDLSKWTHEITAWGGGNGEFQVYTDMPENSFVKNGSLHLKPTLLEENINPTTGEVFGAEFLDEGYLDLEEMFGRCDVPQRNGCRRWGRNINESLPGIPPVASARLRTFERFDFRFGRVEINAKMPVGDWLWPALWLLPENWVYGNWPASGEIDIMEAIGNRDLKCGEDEHYRDINHVSSALHWGVDDTQNRFYLTTNGVDNTTYNYGDYFHKYRLDWSPQGFEMYVDEDFILRVPEVPIMDRDEENCWTGFYDFGKPWVEDDEDRGPWNPEGTCYDLMTPFDQTFHFLFNIAVGGTNYYIPEDCVNNGGIPEDQKPWENDFGDGEPPQEPAMWDFYEARDRWFSTWTTEGDNNNMQVDYIRVWQLDEYEQTQTPDYCPQPPPSARCID